MMRWVLLALALLLTPVSAQIISDDGFFSASTPATPYQGPGDILAGATPWGSCARVYTAALATTTTSLCDLVAVTGGAAVCTLRGTTSGTVDLSAYCPGSLTPSAACAAASGGSCVISKVYDQAGTNHYLAPTLATSPPIVFSALNGLPGISCGNGSTNLQFQTTNAITQAQPNSMSVVVERTSASNAGGVYGGLTSLTNESLNGTASANTLSMNAGSPVNISATDNAFHRINFVFNSTTSAYQIDAVDTSPVTAGTNGFSALKIGICRSGGGQFAGVIMEGGTWLGIAFNATQRGQLDTQQKSVYGLP